MNRAIIALVKLLKAKKHFSKNYLTTYIFILYWILFWIHLFFNFNILKKKINYNLPKYLTHRCWVFYKTHVSLSVCFRLKNRNKKKNQGRKAEAAAGRVTREGGRSRKKKKKDDRFRCLWIKVPYPVTEDCTCSCRKVDN